MPYYDRKVRVWSRKLVGLELRGCSPYASNPFLPLHIGGGHYEAREPHAALDTKLREVFGFLFKE